MKYDPYGQQIYTEDDICELYLKSPEQKFGKFIVDKPISIPDIIELENIPTFILYSDPKTTKEKFDENFQTNWLIPDAYKDFDIASYVLGLCSNEAELQRAGQELLMFQERGMLPLLVYLKYLVDTMRQHNIVWGVGRGSSVSSFVLFLLGIHRINSLYYDLSIDEFLK